MNRGTAYWRDQWRQANNKARIALETSFGAALSAVRAANAKAAEKAKKARKRKKKYKMPEASKAKAKRGLKFYYQVESKYRNNVIRQLRHRGAKVRSIGENRLVASRMIGRDIKMLTPHWWATDSKGEPLR